VILTILFSLAMDSVKDPGRLPSKPALEPSPLLELARLQHQPNKLICVGCKERLLNTMGSKHSYVQLLIYSCGVTKNIATY
jgi:hypothetical protein